MRLRNIKSDANLIDYLKGKIEKLASEEYKVERKSFYSEINKLPKASQVELLTEIFNCIWVWSSDTKREVDKEKLRRRKQYEYLVRTGKRIKFEEFSDPWLFKSDKVTHRPTEVFRLCLYDLFRIFRKHKIKPIYKQLATCLEIFCGRFFDEETIRRQLIRLRKDPNIREYEQTRT